MTTIKAIETSYAGCRFRSRTEARWAVFFDQLEIEWQYEPQGFEFDGERYLPDFILPGMMNIAVEVKGEMSDADSGKILRFAYHGRSVLVLRDIPNPSSYGPHHVFVNQLLLKGQKFLERLSVSFYQMSDGTFGLVPFGWSDVFTDSYLDHKDVHNWNICNSGWVKPSPRITAAYAAARSARFEHGETGPPIPPARTSFISVKNQDSASGSSATAQGSTAWCGQCDSMQVRYVEDPNGQIRPCPRCHPLRSLKDQP